MPPKGARAMPRESFEHRVAGWVVPVLLSALVSIGGGLVSMLFGIKKELGDIATSMALIAYRVDDHERRLDNLETLFLKTYQNP